MKKFFSQPPYYDRPIFRFIASPLDAHRHPFSLKIRLLQDRLGESIFPVFGALAQWARVCDCGPASSLFVPLSRDPMLKLNAPTSYSMIFATLAYTRVVQIKKHRRRRLILRKYRRNFFFSSPHDQIWMPNAKPIHRTINVLGRYVKLPSIRTIQQVIIALVERRCKL